MRNLGFNVCCLLRRRRLFQLLTKPVPRLFAGVCERMKEGLRDEHPDATEEEIHSLLLQRLACLRKLDTTRHAIP